MAQLLFFICVLGMALHGAWCKPDSGLDRPPVVRGARGDSVTLPCACGSCDFPDFRSEWVYNGRHGSGASKQIAVKSSSKPPKPDPESKFSVTHQLNPQSSLLIRNLQLNDSGVYTCKLMKRLPPPSLAWTGPATRLEVYVSPHVSLSASATEAALNSTLVICLVSDFYPEALHVTLNTTCGGRMMLDHNTASITVAPSGTFTGTYRALVDTAGCPNGTEVTCSVRQFAAETRSTIWVPGMRNEAPTQQLPAYFLLIPITAAVLVLGLIFFVVLFKIWRRDRQQPQATEDAHKSKPPGPSSARSRGSILTLPMQTSTSVAQGHRQDDPQQPTNMQNTALFPPAESCRGRTPACRGHLTGRPGALPGLPCFSQTCSPPISDPGVSRSHCWEAGFSLGPCLNYQGSPLLALWDGTAVV